MAVSLAAIFLSPVDHWASQVFRPCSASLFPAAPVTQASPALIGRACVVSENMASLSYRFTFIDITSEEGSVQVRDRPRSASPSRNWTSIQSPETKARDAAAWRHLRTLQHGFDANAPSDDSSNPSSDAPPSVGSNGHPILCKRPCVLFARFGLASCQRGAACGFCHYEPGLLFSFYNAHTCLFSIGLKVSST